LSEQFLNTREAAEFLRVSEASIRRWTDAGRLATRRVGGRQERRFTEDDLRQFMTRGQPATRTPGQGVDQQVSLRGVNLAVPCHLSTYFSSEEGRFRLSIPFLGAGLRAGNPCFLIASERGLAAYAQALATDGVDMGAATESGRLIIRASPGGTAGQALAYWEEAWGRALEKGPAVIRVVGDMALELEAFASVEEMMSYEETYDVLARRFPVATICQYDVRAFDGVSMLRSLKAHPDVYRIGLGNFLV
jgi:excisionase family DNA binding protein